MLKMIAWKPIVAIRKYSFFSRSDGSATMSDTSTPAIDASTNEISRSLVKCSASSAVA